VFEIIQWFARVGDREYPSVPGTLAMIDLARLKRDRDYGLKCFLTYMGARKDAPKGCTSAWIKAVGQRPQSAALRELFKRFYHDKANEDRNPMWDEANLAAIDVPACVESVKKESFRLLSVD
jgi:hypothetical protein